MSDVNEDLLKRNYYRYVHTSLNGKREPRWRGIRVIKFPSDLILYSQVIQKRRPDIIIETGTAYGGSALFFADMLNIQGLKGRVITIDVKGNDYPKHPCVTYVKGSSVDPVIFDQIQSETSGLKTMVVLDSDHSTEHVRKEMEMYSKIVTKGQYMVVEDCWTRHEKPYLPWYAVEDFLKVHPEFRRFDLEKQFIFAVSRDGWLRKI